MESLAESRTVSLAIERGWIEAALASECARRAAIERRSFLDVARTLRLLDTAQCAALAGADQAAHSTARTPSPGVFTLEAGTHFAAFEVVRLLGQGGMGAVYQVRKDGMDYALKLLLAAGSAEDELRFEREAQAAAKLDRHPNIVRIHSFGRERGRSYMVCECVFGRGLDAHIEGADPWPEDRALDLGVAICGALAHMHACGIVHRDLKPGNILMRAADGVPLVTDFGLAKDWAAKTLTRTGEILGTPAYMAPEQIQGAEVSPATDLWALGIILYELTTGARPFEAAAFMELANLITAATPARPRTLRPDLHPDFERIILRCLSRDPEDRPRHARELQQELQRVRSGEPLERASGQQARRLTRALKRQLGGRPGRLLGVIALSIALGGGALLWARTATSERDRCAALLDELLELRRMSEPLLQRLLAWRALPKELAGDAPAPPKCHEVLQRLEELGTEAARTSPLALELRSLWALEQLARGEEAPCPEPLRPLARVRAALARGDIDAAIAAQAALSDRGNLAWLRSIAALEVAVQRRDWTGAREACEALKITDFTASIQGRVLEEAVFNARQPRDFIRDSMAAFSTLVAKLAAPADQVIVQDWNQRAAARLNGLVEQPSEAARVIRLLQEFARGSTVIHPPRIESALHALLARSFIEEDRRAGREAAITLEAVGHFLAASKDDPNLALPPSYQPPALIDEIVFLAGSVKGVTNLNPQARAAAVAKLNVDEIARIERGLRIAMELVRVGYAPILSPWVLDRFEAIVEARRLPTALEEDPVFPYWLAMLPIPESATGWSQPKLTALFKNRLRGIPALLESDLLGDAARAELLWRRARLRLYEVILTERGDRSSLLCLRGDLERALKLGPPRWIAASETFAGVEMYLGEFERAYSIYQTIDQGLRETPENKPVDARFRGRLVNNSTKFGEEDRGARDRALESVWRALAQIAKENLMDPARETPARFEHGRLLLRCLAEAKGHGDYTKWLVLGERRLTELLDAQPSAADTEQLQAMRREIETARVAGWLAKDP